jgi:hypothetical protein
VAINRMLVTRVDAMGLSHGGSRLLLTTRMIAKERDTPPRKAVASSRVAAFRGSGHRVESPPDKPGASDHPVAIAPGY